MAERKEEKQINREEETSKERPNNSETKTTTIRTRINRERFTNRLQVGFG